jgi:hypothetical protein
MTLGWRGLTGRLRACPSGLAEALLEKLRRKLLHGRARYTPVPIRVEVIGDFSEMMGHAGAVVPQPNSLIEGADDPCADGAVIAF